MPSVSFAIRHQRPDADERWQAGDRVSKTAGVVPDQENRNVPTRDPGTVSQDQKVILHVAWHGIGRNPYAN